MVKELLLAILLGALLGFGLTGSILGIRHRNAPSANVSPTITNTPTSPPPTGGPTATPNNSTLTINSPEDESIVSTAKTDVIGSATANSLIVIKTSKGIYTTTTDEQGKFTQNIQLDNGYNNVHISSIDSQDNQSNVDLNVTFSTAKF